MWLDHYSVNAYVLLHKNKLNYIIYNNDQIIYVTTYYVCMF